MRDLRLQYGSREGRELSYPQFKRWREIAGVPRPRNPRCPMAGKEIAILDEVWAAVRIFGLTFDELEEQIINQGITLEIWCQNTYEHSLLDHLENCTTRELKNLTVYRRIKERLND